jgi:hypothetical protein
MEILEPKPGHTGPVTELLYLYLLLDSSTLVGRIPAVFGKHLDVLVKIHIILPTQLTRS